MRPDIYVLYLLLRLVSLLPLRTVHAIGAWIGRRSLRSNSRSARYTAVNLRLTRPELGEAERADLLRRTMEEAGKSVAEVAAIWGGGAEKSLGLVREVVGGELFADALASGKGVIVAAPHLGCWELLNYWLCSKTPMAILYRPPRIQAIEALLRKVRGKLAPEQVRAEGAGVRTLFKRLGAGGTVGILPDQKPREGEGEFAPFFGVEALTMVLLPRLAARTGAIVLFSFAERLPDGEGFRIHVLPAPEGIDSTDLKVACTALNRGVEQCVERAFPQYQWHYKRYTAHDRPDPYKVTANATGG
ncbi:lipid A biosynthesis acyltransferase [Luteibacter jiangsuensis]|uniref:Lipid A biosynthesis acyltransferase n=1 Tax=Luteibacter jiangsuensis TaxID=637577 RepID=A0ABX0Q561_9GAMM|nr:lipid A biosynthesis acyltransferase [Luteibacter jiangsuensis]NID04876.1 lipid A biosynthesis acyltransferase [Luteibacter jiangsuensis]